MSIHRDNWPRVSTILRVLDDSYAGVPEAALRAAAERGEALHKLCLSYLAAMAGLCEEPRDVPPVYAAAFSAFVNWCREAKPEPLAVEQYGRCTAHHYGGTPDALVSIGGKETLIDLKFTASILRINRVQVQAYRRLDEYKGATRTMLVHIGPVDGDLKVHTIPNNPQDWAAFLNALSVWKWRQP